MPHYRNGRLARAGDLVRGRGYNVRREIEGVVLGVSPSNTCNLRVAYVAPEPVDLRLLIGTRKNQGEVLLQAAVRQEYGECGSFVALDPSTGAVLDPDSAPAEEPPPDRQQEVVHDAGTAADPA